MKPVIIGGGLAGLTVALSLAPMPVVVLSPKKLGVACSSAWAQGGVAAAIGADDSAALHAADTLAAGAGLSDAATVQRVTEDGAKVIEKLLACGVPFDRDAEGRLRLGLEAAHSRRRIVHATDATGAAIMNALIAAVHATPSIEVVEEAHARELMVDEHGMRGVVIERDGATSIMPASQVVLATGGAGGLWKETSNPLGSWGGGLALAAEAGAALGDLEFMQFHPTAIAIGRDPMPLASEALRGEGCTLIDETGARFTDELQPRDIVARAIFKHRADGHGTFLDARAALGRNFAKRFPTVHALCASASIDPAMTPIPVAPAAHYHMGGVMTDAHGRTTIEGLWACGEVACTGLHGANRLASNSLLEAASFGRRVAEDLRDQKSPTRLREGLGAGGELATPRASTHLRTSPPLIPPASGREEMNLIRTIMSQHVGVIRDAEGLKIAVRKLAPLATTHDMALVALMIATSALQREESRGAHTRADFPVTNPAWQRRQTTTLADMRHTLEPTMQKVIGA